MEKAITILKREISQTDIVLINELIRIEGEKGRTHISRKLCKIWEWKTPNSQYRDIACRDLLRRLEKKGLITLPPMLKSARKVGYVNKTKLPSDFKPIEKECKLREISEIKIKMVRGSQKEKLYNGLIGNYHYLGYHQGNGEQVKYIITGDGIILGCIGFSGAAYKIESRDKHIGWDKPTRERNLSKIANNNRFLILPWIKIPNLASYILGKVSRQIAEDYKEYYKREIVLLETFVEKERFIGTSYKASNWQYLGETTGRGRNDRYSKNRVPIKDIFIYPLTKRYKEYLRVESRKAKKDE